MPMKPATDAMLTIFPERCCFMAGTTASIAMNVPLRFTAIIRSTSSSDADPTGVGAKMPALLIKTSIRPNSAITFATSALRSADFNALVANVIAEFGRIDVLINSAGIFAPTPVGSASEEDVDRMIAVNLKGTFMAIDAVVPAMKQQRSGKIVSIASVAGFMGIGSYAIYCATKAGVISMTRTLACELAPHGINVNAVA